MITSLRLENWRSHQESEFTFSPGTNVLVGIVGSGKSSVLDGMCFALFGTFPALQQRRIKLDELIRNKPAQAEKARVAAKFTVGDQEYEVSREIKQGKGTSSAELRLDGKLIEGPNAHAVTRKVEELLGADHDLFSRAIYAEQNQMDYFLRIPKGQRMSKIDDLLRIDRFEKARKNCLTVSNEFKNAIGERERVLGDFEGLKKEEGARVKEGLMEIEKRVDVEEKKYVSVDKEKVSLEKEVRDAELAYREFTNLSVKTDQLAERKGELEKVLKGVKNLDIKKVEDGLEKTQKNLNECQQELNKFLTAIEVNQQSLEKFVQEKANLEQLKVALEKLDVEKLEADVKKLKIDYEKLKGREQELKTRKGLLEKSIEVIEHSEECPVCKTKLEEAKRKQIKKEEGEELAKIEVELSGLDVGALKDELEGNEITLKRAEQLESMIKNLGDPGKEVERLEKQIEGLKEKCVVKESEQEKCREKVSDAQELKRFLDMQTEIAGLKEQIETCEKDIGKLGFNEKEYRKRKEKFETLLDEWSRAKAKYESSSEILKERERQKKEFEERLGEMEKLRAGLKGMKNGHEFLVKFQNALKVTQSELRRQFVKSLNETMSELWNCYPYGDYSSIRLAIEEGDYVLQVKETRGKWIGVEGTVSGGERSTAALVLRMAFALVLAPQLSMLVLDEPTHNLDTRSVEELAITLRDRIKDYINQVFVITHDEALEGAVSGTLYRLERNKADDGPTEVVLSELEI